MLSYIKVLWDNKLAVLGGLCLALIAYIVISHLLNKLDSIETQLVTVQAQLTSYQRDVSTANEIDERLTKELANDRENLNQLRDDVNSGLKRLSVNTETDNSKTSTGSVANANTCRLSKEAEQNYFSLKDDIITKDKMIIGLQEYIRSVCLVE